MQPMGLAPFITGLQPWGLSSLIKFIRAFEAWSPFPFKAFGNVSLILLVLPKICKLILIFVPMTVEMNYNFESPC